MYRIDWSQPAVDDLDTIAAWIEEQAGTAIAGSYVERVRVRVNRLADFPHRGIPRDDLRPGVRSIPFERRLIILYRVGDAAVTILRVINSARDVRQAFHS